MQNHGSDLNESVSHGAEWHAKVEMIEFYACNGLVAFGFQEVRA